MDSAEETERAPLLAPPDRAEAGTSISTTPMPDSPPSPSDTTLPSPGEANAAVGGQHEEDTIARFLPIAFTASFAIAATSATTIYAYASITCADPARCQDEEQDRYAGVVALATTVANFFGVLAVGFLRPWTESHPKLGLYFWILCRATGIAILAVGVLVRNINVAIAGRVFDGLATDNILHYALAAVYLRTKMPGRFSQLMGTSLGLYMVGMSLSPTIVTLLPSFIVSFVVAIALLGLSLLYLCFLVPPLARGPERGCPARPVQQETHPNSTRTSFLEPVFYFHREPIVALPGLAVLLYNSAQAYLFPVIMVHAALRYGFTSTENGYLISLAAATSSVYLLVTLYIVPRVRSRFRIDRRGAAGEAAAPSSRKTYSENSRLGRGRYYFNADLSYALLSMSIQLAVLPLFPMVHSAGSIYGLVVLVALGLAAPSFIKSYAVLGATDKGSAVAGMAVTESAGGLLSPIILGAIQSMDGQGSVFFVASSLVGAAMLCLLATLCLGSM
ncbi:hypothetical protein PFICI_09672 [Pestalotiopsis fici W106-1]|uniref:Major facilitator superfamily (MFS) profile domain-containing protein n=1 Tax=Pestalotiopsis fici (strain W106-1 / CGMCC3.15140) TaxID=1229662 RepID=W3WUU7_PESFW|nr:uncharacterized protein PFICI_09672 [Pestalotiopsis fici W106-1]ETS77610.1 hypothetical protein PFICI_09672 [Pestalotiopsis fici W106-1]